MSTEKFIRDIERKLKVEIPEKTRQRLKRAIDDYGMSKLEFIENIEEAIQKDYEKIKEEKKRS